MTELIKETQHSGDQMHLLCDENDRPPIEALIYAEYSCVVWFTIEFVTRIIVEVDRREFMRKPLNIIDLLTILPFYAENMLPFIGISAITLKKFSAAMLVMRVLRVARVARIFKLARYSSGLQTIGDTFRQSMQELSMLGMLLTTGIIFFATVTYFLEKDEPKTGFKSIPAACWWCVITMTTVGYGDVVPVTSGGKLVATMASISGIVVLAFPISMIVEKFAVAQETMAAEQKKKALLAGIHVSPSGTPAPPSAPPGANSAEAPQKMRRAFGGKFGGRRRKPPPTPYTPAAQSEQINNRA